MYLPSPSKPNDPSFWFILSDITMENASWPTYPNPPFPWDTPDPFGVNGSTPVHFEILRYGYGWGFRGIPIKVAVAVLLLQALMTLIHTVTICFGRWTSGCWTTVGEIIVLAINSVHTERLRNTSAGVQELSTWKESVKVREKSMMGSWPFWSVMEWREVLA